jgi:hypothetical protein
MSAAKPTDEAARIRALMDALAESAEGASDAEVLDDAAEEGVEIKTQASRTRGVLLAGLERAAKSRLRAAATEHTAAVASMRSRATALPSDPAARRLLLERTLARRPDVREAVITMQHRDFSTFSDADVESALRQLQHLGVMDGEPESKK